MRKIDPRVLEELYRDDGNDSITFRGAARGNVLDPEDPVDPLLEYLTAGWHMVGDREYPPWYYHALSKFVAHPADIERMREAVASIPRADPYDYDILFNGSIRSWEIVKWIAQPGPQILAGDLGWMTFVIRQPLDVHTLLPFGRPPSSLGERDWAWIRRNSTTLRDPGEVTADVNQYNDELKRDRERQREDRELDLAEYNHARIRREAEESGVAYATPEQMAEVLGGEPWMYDDNLTVEE